MEDFSVFTKSECRLLVRCADMLTNHVNESQKCSVLAKDIYGFLSDLSK